MSIVNTRAPPTKAADQPLTDVAVLSPNALQISEGGFGGGGRSVAPTFSLGGLENIFRHDWRYAAFHDDPVFPGKVATGLDPDGS
ncbi:hypothetical protein D3C87_1826100 [compost metagenome]